MWFWKCKNAGMLTYSSYFNMLSFLSLVHSHILIWSVCIQLIECLFILYPGWFFPFKLISLSLFSPILVLTDVGFCLARSRVKLIYHIYVHDSIEPQNSYLVLRSIRPQLIFGQLAVSLLNCFWARFVSLFCFCSCCHRHHHHLL
jgi:hypothetical protein